MAEEFENKEVQSEQNENSRDGYSAAEQGGCSHSAQTELLCSRILLP